MLHHSCTLFSLRCQQFVCVVVRALNALLRNPAINNTITLKSFIFNQSRQILLPYVNHDFIQGLSVKHALKRYSVHIHFYPSLLLVSDEQPSGACLNIDTGFPLCQ